MLHLQFVGARMEIWPTTNCHRLISILQINFSLATISNNWKCIRNECVMTGLENGQLILGIPNPPFNPCPWPGNCLSIGLWGNPIMEPNNFYQLAGL